MELQNAKVIDVRSPMEFNFGHVDGAVNIPLETIAARLEELRDYTETLVLCCASGGRSAMACQFLAQKGFDNLYDAGPWQNANVIMNNFK